MAVADKIKSLMTLKGKTHKELAEHLGLASTQVLYNKFARDNLSVTDLIKAVEFLDCELTIIVDENQRIRLNQNDTKPKDA